MANTPQNGPRPGALVILKGIPPGFLDDLPDEDKEAISEVVGKPIVLNEYDDDGRAELEFKDSAGVIHCIYVAPNFITPAE